MAVVGGGPQHRITFAGLAAVIRLGYQRAAELGAWRMEGGYLTAEIRTVDAFRITQTPLVLEITYADGEPTRRPLADVTVTGGRLTARIVPKS